MKIKSLEDEDFVDYKEPSMSIGTAFCSGKCCKEAGRPMTMCQNSDWLNMPIIDVDDDTIIKRYLANNLTKAICFCGLEPFEQFLEMYSFIRSLRRDYQCDDTVVIYTGFTENEIGTLAEMLKPFGNIIIKFGRFVPDQKKHLDEVLGIELASDNQYAKKIC